MEQAHETSNILIYSNYGLVFFTMGVAALLQLRRQSRLALAGSLWLLAGFGILQSLAIWGYFYIAEQAEILPAHLIVVYWFVHGLVGALSYALLLQFGIDLVWPSIGHRWVRLSPAIVLGLWAAFFVSSSVHLGIAPEAMLWSDPFATRYTLARYLLAFPGATLAAVALFQQARVVEAMDLLKSAGHLRSAAWAFLAYAILALSHDLLERTGALPMPFIYSFIGLTVSYFVVRSFEVFDAELALLLEEITRSQAIARERERISRELHDGTIQSIFGAGLALEDVIYTLDEAPELARDKTRKVMASLDGVITDIRRYIHDVRAEMENREFEATLVDLAHSYAAQAGLRAEVHVIPSWRRPLSPNQAENLLQIAREALANVAKHARATRLTVVLCYEQHAAVFRVEDNGRGFRPRGAAHETRFGRGQGLRNIAQRVELLGGTVRVESSPNAGTRVIAEVPYSPREGSSPEPARDASAEAE